uniref:Thioester dehydrase family protein n=2 Tax=Magnetospirillum gryphiswaldense TaxID=55518 RepID=A4TU50_9PROT|nr:thioester dehydrase family protein [Magnetospirillum gryphiswaldense MSR-1]
MIEPTLISSHAMDSGIALDLYLDPDLLWFRGHFPQLPLLPGVVQLDWALLLAGRHLGLTAQYTDRFQVKYKAGLFPGDHVTLVLRHDVAKGRLGFDYRRDGVTCSNGSLVVGP